LLVTGHAKHVGIALALKFRPDDSGIEGCAEKCQECCGTRYNNCSSSAVTSAEAHTKFFIRLSMNKVR
jgi:hypothetical protein